MHKFICQEEKSRDPRAIQSEPSWMLGVLMMFCIEEDFGENKGKEKMKT
jgi:hypothetical protein